MNSNQLSNRLLTRGSISLQDMDYIISKVFTRWALSRRYFQADPRERELMFNTLLDHCCRNRQVEFKREVAKMFNIRVDSWFEVIKTEHVVSRSFAHVRNLMMSLSCIVPGCQRISSSTPRVKSKAHMLDR